jgi:hypothetical protein
MIATRCAAMTIAAVFAAAILAAPGCLQRGAIDARPSVASPSLSARLDSPQAASQPVTATAGVTAGHDARQTQTTIAAAGSGWPLVAAVVGVSGVLVLARGRSVASRRLGVLARAVKETPPGADRDHLLWRVREEMGPRRLSSWNGWLERRGLRVHRQEGTHPGRFVSSVAPSRPPGDAG